MIYFIQAHSGGPVKIGYAANPEKRIAEIQRMSPVELKTLKIIEGDLKQEKELHKHFAKFRLHGEWFDLNEKMLNIVIPLPEKASEKKQPTRVVIDRAGFTIKEISEALQFNEKTIRHWIKTGLLKTLDTSGVGCLVDPDSLRRLGTRIESR